MYDAARRTVLSLLILAGAAPTAARAQFREEMDLSEVALSGTTPESIILLWPTFSYRLARLMIARYGQPAEYSDHSLVWIDNAPWKRTVVYRVPPGDRPIAGEGGRLEQSAAYRVPENRVSDLGRFDPDIEADAKAGRLTAISDDESDNFLALNLADDVIRGRRSPKEAAEFRRKQARLRDSGKSSAYLTRLLFVPAGSSANPESPD